MNLRTKKVKSTNCFTKFVFGFVEVYELSFGGFGEKSGERRFALLEKIFPEDADLLSRKGIYPYEFMDSFEKFDLKSLPEKNEFFSQLNGEISDEDFSHAKKVWEKMGIQNLGEYHDLYFEDGCFSPGGCR